MKIIIVEARKINHSSFRALDNKFQFFACFATRELAENYIKSTTMPGAVWYGYFEFNVSEQEIFES